MVSSQERKPKMVSFRNHKPCSCWIQRPQARRKTRSCSYTTASSHIMPMLPSLSSQSYIISMSDALSLKLWKNTIAISHGQVNNQLTLMNKPSKKRFAQFIQSILIWTDHLHHHSKYQGNKASNESHQGQKTPKNTNKEVQRISIFGMILTNPESYSRIQGFAKQTNKYQAAVIIYPIHTYNSI